MEELNKYFSTEKKNVTIGVEAEMYLYDAENECLLEHNDEYDKILAKCWEKLPETVTKDYHNYQLEIRTKPHDNPENLIKEFHDTLLLCRSVFAKHNIEIKPLSWLGGDELYNGLHVHFKNGGTTKYQNNMFNMYPFVLAITDCFKNSPESQNIISRRFRNSQHLGIPNIEKLSERMINEKRYKDIIVNGCTENNRHRLKSVPTIEVRSFDLPYSFEYFKNLIRLMFNVFKYINSKEQVKTYETYDECYTKLTKTREDIGVNRVGYNFFFDCTNTQIYDYLCDKFNIEKLKVPAIFADNNPLQNRTELQKHWRKFGTWLWLGEKKLGDKYLEIEKPKYTKPIPTRVSEEPDTNEDDEEQPEYLDEEAD